MGDRRRLARKRLSVTGREEGKLTQVKTEGMRRRQRAMLCMCAGFVSGHQKLRQEVGWACFER